MDEPTGFRNGSEVRGSSLVDHNGVGEEGWGMQTSRIGSQAVISHRKVYGCLILYRACLDNHFI